MTTATKVYNSSQVLISIGGFPIDSGYADGEFLRIERETDSFTDVVGTDGEVTRSETRDRRATATILLMQTSRANQVLSALNNLDEITPGGVGIVPFQVLDRNTEAQLYIASSAWVMKPPDSSFDREATAREWAIRLGNLVQNLQGT